MLFASAHNYFLYQIARYKYHRIQKVLSKASIHLQKLHDENKDFEASYQSRKSAQKQLGQSELTLLLNEREIKQKRKCFGFFKSKNEKSNIFNAKYPDADNSFKSLYVRQHAIKSQYEKTLKSISKYCAHNLKWIRRYEKKNKISNFTYLEKLSLIVSDYDKTRKQLNLYLKKTPELNHEHSSHRVPFYSKIRITAAFFRAPQKQASEIEIEKSCMLNTKETMTLKSADIRRAKLN